MDIITYLFIYLIGLIAMLISLIVVSERDMLYSAPVLLAGPFY